MALTVADIILGILAVFLPPLPVILIKGIGLDLVINLLLCLLAWIPGILHAWYLIAKQPSAPRKRH